MSEIYLTRIDLENFRTFGKFGLDLPAAPNLTLLVGTNGLGKSNFFDGLEWGLTGRIRRFTDHLTSSIRESDYLTSREAPPNSHSVSLGYSTGTSVFRSATANPSQSTVIELLKNAEWGAKIEDVATYLAFTHFLGQAAQQRFTSRGRNEQWESLKGPSGIDRLEEVRSALRGAPTRNAFRRRLEEQQEAIHGIGGALSEWREMTARLLRLRQAADAAGDMSGALLDNRIGGLMERLRKSPQDAAPAVDGSASQRLLAVREEITRRLAEVARRRAALQGLERLAASYALVRASAASEGTVLVTAREAAEAAIVMVTSAEQASRLAQDRLRDHAMAINALESEITRLTSARGALDQIVASETKQAALAEDLSAVEQALSVQRAEVSQADKALERDIRRRADLAALEAADATAKSFITRARELARLGADFQRKASESAAAESNAADARAQAPSLRQNNDRCRTAIEISEQKLADARRKASEMVAAVARVASHLDEHDLSCPICMTVFEPGILKELADKAASAQNAELAAIEGEHVRIVARASEIEHELAAATSLISLADSAAATTKEACEQVTAFRRTLAAGLGLDEGSDLLAAASHRETDATMRLAIFNAELDADAPSVAAAHAIKAAAAIEIDDLDRRRLELTQARADVTIMLRSLREGLAASGHGTTTASILSAALAERNMALAEAHAERAKLELESVGATTIEAGARQRAAAAQGELARLSATFDATTRNAAALQSQWTQAGLDREPTSSTLEIALAELARQSGDLNLLLDEQAALAAASEAALQRLDLANLVQSMENKGGPGSADDPSYHERSLKMQLDAATAERNLTESARTAVNALSDKLKKEAEDFSTQFLIPLNDLIDDYNKALLNTPGESIRFNAAHSVDRTKFDMRLRYRDRLDEAIYNTELPPQIVLSEGQLAANGFSILCAASTAYPWSRWRALLLDDPLQHNDVIHAAAFADVMRNLVELQGYQLIMSSHDRAEGEFFFRKFDAAALPCTVVTLTVPSRDGVRFEPPRHNSAARALMENRLARSG